MAVVFCATGLAHIAAETTSDLYLIISSIVLRVGSTTHLVSHHTF